MNPDNLLIWWTTAAECKQLLDEEDEVRPEIEASLPAYLLVELRSRIGRDGRGRLWCPPGMDLAVDPWPHKYNAARIHYTSAAGIVFQTEDLPLVLGLPGFVTDRYLDDVEVEQ